MCPGSSPIGRRCSLVTVPSVGCADRALLEAGTLDDPARVTRFRAVRTEVEWCKGSSAGTPTRGDHTMAGNTSTPEQVGEYYDHAVDWFAEVFGDNSHVGYWSPQDDSTDLEQGGDNLTDLMIEQLEVGPGRRVLDVGCGVGRPAVRLGQAARGERARRANELARGEDVAYLVSFQQADAMKLPFEDGSFDAAWALESIMHMPDRRDVLGQIERVLRPGGRMALTDLFEWAPAGPEQRTALEGYLKGMESS